MLLKLLKKSKQITKLENNPVLCNGERSIVMFHVILY